MSCSCSYREDLLPTSPPYWRSALSAGLLLIRLLVLTFFSALSLSLSLYLIAVLLLYSPLLYKILFSSILLAYKKLSFLIAKSFLSVYA